MPVRDLLSAASTQGGSGTDPNFKNVSLLLNGDGTNGSQNNTFLDSSTNNFTITKNGNVTQGSFSPYGNLWSNYFNASNSCYLNTATNATAFAMGTGDYTIEGWACKTSTTDDEGIFGTEATGIRLYWYSGNLIHQCGLNSGGGSGVSVSETVPSLNTWFHWACVRSSGTIRLYINGVSTTSTGSATANITSTYMTIGRELVNYASYYWDGYISNVRAVKGTAVYTSNFTPSTTPLTAISGTSLLTCQSNRFIDNSSNAFAITTTGTPSVQRFSPFNPTSAYDSSVLGGSMVTLDANSYLSYTQSTYSGSVTMEGWVYLISGGNGQSCPFGNSSGNYAVDIYQPESCIIWYIYYPQGTSGIRFNFTGDVKVRFNEWMHFAFVRNGTSIKLYFNGVDASTIAGVSIQGSTTNSLTMYNNIMGAYDTASGDGGNVYYSDLRASASAVYTSNFTPPTAPISPTTNTNILCNFTNAGIPDLAMQNNLETVGNAQVNTSVKKYGTGSLSFNGSGSELLASSNPAQVLKGDFTIEGWVYLNSTSGTQTIAARWQTSNQEYLFWVTSGTVQFFFASYSVGTALVSSSSTISATTWTYVAITRSGSTFTLYINGTSVGTATNSSAMPSTSSATTIGSILPSFSGYDLNGYIDDIRITNGLARAITTPTSALPTY